LKECFKCKSEGFLSQLIDFEKIGEDPVTGKNIWKLLNEDGTEHKHKFRSAGQPQQQEHRSNNNNSYKKDNVRTCIYCTKDIIFHNDVTAPKSGKKIPLNLDHSVHDCEKNPYNQARKERS
jgi:hypothetical protein